MAEHDGSEVAETLALIRACLAGNAAAATRFQDLYGELIYGYPMRAYRVPPDQAGDFYVFAFDNSRIFRRLQTFEGRAPLRAYLLGFVLNDLVLEWNRGRRELDAIPLDALGEAGDLAAPRHAFGDGNGTDESPVVEVLQELDDSKTAILKLLYIEDCDLTAAEIRHVAAVSGRSVPAVLAGIDQLRATVREREAALKAVEDTLDSIQSWIHLYQRQLQQIDAELTRLGADATDTAGLLQERAQLWAKVERRRRQRSKVLERTRRRKVTAPYKEIAALLNTSTGNVGSQIARLRREILAKVENHDSRMSTL